MSSYNYDYDPWADQQQPSSANSQPQQQPPTNGYQSAAAGYSSYADSSSYAGYATTTSLIGGSTQPQQSAAFVGSDSDGGFQQQNYAAADNFQQSQHYDEQQQQQQQFDEQQQYQQEPNCCQTGLCGLLRRNVPAANATLEPLDAVCSKCSTMLFRYVNRDLLVSKVFYFFFYSAFGSLFPLMGVYFKQLGMNPAQVGILTGIRPFIEIFSAPFWNSLAERYRQAKVLLLFSLISWIVFTYSMAHIRPPASQCVAFNDTDYVLYTPYSGNDLANFDTNADDPSLVAAATAASSAASFASANVSSLPAPMSESEKKLDILAGEENQNQQRRRRRRRSLDDSIDADGAGDDDDDTPIADAKPMSTRRTQLAALNTDVDEPLKLGNDFEDLKLRRRRKRFAGSRRTNGGDDEGNGDEEDSSSGGGGGGGERKDGDDEDESKLDEQSTKPEQANSDEQSSEEQSSQEQSGNGGEKGNAEDADEEEQANNKQEQANSQTTSQLAKQQQQQQQQKQWRQTTSDATTTTSKKVFKQRHKTPPTHIVGMSPITVEFAVNYNKEKDKQLVAPMFSTIVYKLDDVKEVFFLLLLLISLGEFFSAPALTLVDSATLSYLADKPEMYERQRMFGSLSWAVTLFFVGMALDNSKVFWEHPCGPHIRERSYTICFTIFSMLMFCAFLVATQFRFTYNNNNNKGVSNSKSSSELQKAQLVTTNNDSTTLATTTTTTSFGAAANSQQNNIDSLYSSTQPRSIFNTAPPINAPPPQQHEKKFEYLEKWRSAIFAQRTRELPQWISVFRQFNEPLHFMYLFVTWFLGCGVGLVFTFLFWHLQDVGGTPTLFGICCIINHISEILAYFFSFNFIKAFGHTKVLSVGLACNVVRFLYVAFLTNPYYALPFELVQGITHAACFAACCSYINHVSKPELRGSSQGVMQGLHHGIGRASGTLIGGFMINAIGSRASFCIYGLCSGVVLAGLLYLRKKRVAGNAELADEDERMKVDESEAFGGFGAPQGVPSAVPGIMVNN